jgi:cytochrome P450
VAASNGATALPPGPRWLPRWVQTAGFMFAPRFFVNAVHRRYGDVVLLRTLFDPGFVMVFEPELIKQLFRGPPEQLRAGEANAVLGPVLGDRSVLLLDGAEHLRQRKLLLPPLPPFHGQRMRAYETVMREAADRAIDSWPVGEPFPLLPSMQSLTLEVIARAVFGVEEGKRKDELTRRIRAMIEPMSTRLGVLLTILSGSRRGARIEQFEERRRRVDEMIYEEIARRREVPDLEEREDVFSMLLLTRDEDGNPMTDHELRDELVTLLVAGHETTATALAWAFELLMRNPAVLERTRAAIAEGDDAYLDAMIKEVLRIRPVISGIGRKVRGEPFELGGYTIPPGIEINPSISAIHRRADRYPQPEEFRPERFLGEDPPDTYTWIPFGGGIRRCLGASFASFEMRVVISRVLERASLRPVGRRPEHAVRRGITFSPSRGARMVMASAPRPAPAARSEEKEAASPQPLPQAK